MKFKGQVDLMGISTPPGIPPRRHDGANLGVIEHASTCTKLQVVGDSDIGHNRGKNVETHQRHTNQHRVGNKGLEQGRLQLRLQKSYQFQMLKTNPKLVS